MLYEICAVVCSILEILLIFIGIFLTERYVFLEQGLEKAKQRKYYLVCFTIILLFNLFSEESLATALIYFVGGLNISLARKKHRIRGFFLIMPIVGIVDGLVVPVLVMPANLLGFSEGDMIIYSLIIYGIIYSLLLLFYYKGKRWRARFQEDMEYRHLQAWESVMLFIVGILLTNYSSSLVSIPAFDGQYKTITQIIASNMCLMGITAFVLTITMIVLIMQGNKRSYYYEKTLNMQRVEMEREKAEAANEAKSMFLSNMSHEIRTPMNAIVGMTDILLREEHSPQTREYLNNIKSSGSALLTIINDILDFSKIESGKMEIVEEEYEPMSMFNDLSMIFLNRIGDKKVELLYDIDKDMPRKLKGDSQRLRQVVINLMNNAIKFTEDGYVRLSVKSHILDNENMELAFEIEDTGQGIREGDIEKLFGSFQQVDTKKNHYKEGTGLGLAISKQLVELMDGSIGVESSYGEGSRFYFTVPQKIVDKRAAAVLKGNAESKSVVEIKIDNKFVREQLQRLAALYSVECVDFDAHPPREVAFLISDNEDKITPEHREMLEKAGGVLCLLQNPMMENISESNVTVLNKPLYSLNFCQLLNREKQVSQSVEDDVLQFVAPQAKILVVDDNDMNLKVAMGLLEPLQMQIDTAHNGKEALLMVQKKAYDIVFMDHMMPIMDGIEATREIRKLNGEAYSKLPIIALSANATAEAKEMFAQEEMNDFVAKPIKLKEIIKCILKWLPQELVTMVDREDKPLEQPHNAEAISLEIEGLNVEEGIRNCGSEKLFLELLGDFYKLIEPKSTKLEKCLEDGMIRDYTIEVHALKNTARMIGAMELSELFYQMEQLGNANEKEQIQERTPEVLKLYRSYKDVLAQYGNLDNQGQEQVSFEKIVQTLTRLHDAMDSFDLDEADSAMKELETYAFPEDMQPMLQQLSAYVADVAMEDVINMTEVMCEKLKSHDKEDKEDRAVIMIVDDDEISTKAVIGMLHEEYSVVTAKSGWEALELLKERIPDLILLDVHMPHMNGHDLIHALKENTQYSDIPVVFLTSDADENTEIQGFSEGATDFIRKPFRKAVAIQRIRRILELSYLEKNLKQEVERQTDVAENRRQKVERMSLQMVHALVNTIEAKDSYTNGHSTRVAKYAVMIAERMGYSGEKLEQLQYAALLHDIGKIGIPREIINKTSRLTDEEYEIIKTHPAIGENILNEISEIPDIAIGARWHHERYDGKGYPDRLKDYEIPEIARIIGVADAYDAMTSKRSYRGVLPQEVVSGEIEKGKSSQFDPNIADVMLQLIKEDTDYHMHE